MAWKDIDRPGYFGKKRNDAYRGLDELYGSGNWRIVWKWLGQDVDFLFACHLYEDAYYADSFNREHLWKKLSNEAKDVYDVEKRDRESCFDYEAQTGRATHLQDIAIRRVVARRGWKFKGKELVQIRSHKSEWGGLLSPGKVPFHLPQYILPGIESEGNVADKISGKDSSFIRWWDKNSIEDFYQSNKFIQAREGDRNNLPALVNEANEIRTEFLRRQERYDRQVNGIKVLLQRETEAIFKRIVTEINAKLKGKASAIKDFNVEGNYVDLNLDCNYEDLGEDEGDIIKATVKSELENKGVSWIKAGFSPSYFGK